jgi:hypothetical protein
MREVPHDSLRRPAPQPRPLTNAEIEQHLARALAALQSLQKPDGHWCGELEGAEILHRDVL